MTTTASAFKDPDLGGPSPSSVLWFDLPDYRTTPNYLSLTEVERAHVEDMRENGFTIVRGALTHEQCDRVIDATEAWRRARDEEFERLRKADGTSPRIINLHMDIAELREPFLSDASLRLQDVLFGFPTSIYTSIYFFQGSQQPIHRDVPVFHTYPENYYFGVWFAFENATEQNGTLQAIPGGHKIHIDPLPMSRSRHQTPESIHPTNNPELWRIYQAAVSAACAEADLKLKVIDLHKGDMFIWHPLLPHGGGGIRQKSLTRNSIVYHTVPRGVPVGQMDTFFNWEQPSAPKTSRFSYKTMERYRFMADQGRPKIVAT